MIIKNGLKLGLTLLTILLLTGSVYAQSKNIFHDRGFWAKKPSIENIEAKISEGNDIMEMGPNGWDGTLLAIMADAPYKTVKHLLDKGPDVNQMTHHSNNYLMWTAMKGNLPVMELLVEKGSRTDLINSHGQSLLMHVALSGKADKALYEFCLAHGADMVNDKEEHGKNVALVAIGKLEDLSFLDYFVEKGVRLESKDAEGNGLFHAAVSSGNLETLKFLVSKGIGYEPNAQTGENAFNFVGVGRTPVVSVELLAYLKDLGLNPANVTKEGQSALHTLAGRAGDVRVFDYFLKEGLNSNTPNKDGDTPLLLAARNGKEEIVKYWVEKSQDINLRNKKGQTPVALAIEGNNSLKVLQLLANNGADFKWKDEKGRNLTYALTISFNGKIGDYQAKLDYLKSKGINPADEALLHIAVEKGEFELLKFLLEEGVNINKSNLDGYTPLHYAAMNAKDTGMLKFLVDKGADTLMKTEFEESVHDLALENEALEHVDLSFLKGSR